MSVVAGAQTASHSTAIREHLQKAAEYLKANNPKSAVDEFNAVLVLDPKNAEANANLGVIAFFQRDYQKASQYLRKAAMANPALIKTEALLGICQKRLGDPAARATLEKSFARLKDKPLRMQVGLELAGLYDQQGDSGGTASVMRSLVDLDPDNVDVLFMAQRVYSELADETLNKLAVLAPGSARMQQVIAERLVNNGDLAGAIDHYRKALQLDLRISGVHYELGEAIFESATGDAAGQAEAENQLQIAIAQEGDSAKVRCELGRIALTKFDVEKAREFYERAFALGSGDACAQLGMGQVLINMNKPEEARKYLEMAVKTDPLNQTAHYRLAMAYRRMQLPDDAEKELHLFDEIKKTKQQIEDLYRQMNIKPKPSADAVQDSEK